MKNKIVMAIMGVMTVLSMTMAASMAPVFAAETKTDSKTTTDNSAGKVNCPTGTKRAGNEVSSYAECNMDPTTSTNGANVWDAVSTIINVVLSVIGIVAVIMIIYGGFKIATSAGAADKVKSGKDTIIYGIIGMVIALFAYAIVNFVLKSVFGGSSTNNTNSGIILINKGKE